VNCSGRIFHVIEELEVPERDPLLCVV
jgi:hypothetical protein